MKTENIIMRVTQIQKEKVTRLALEDDKSITQYIIDLINREYRNYVKEKD